MRDLHHFNFHKLFTKMKNLVYKNIAFLVEKSVVNPEQCGKSKSFEGFDMKKLWIFHQLKISRSADSKAWKRCFFALFWVYYAFFLSKMRCLHHFNFHKLFTKMKNFVYKNTVFFWQKKKRSKPRTMRKSGIFWRFWYEKVVNILSIEKVVNILSIFTNCLQKWRISRIKVLLFLTEKKA